MAEPGEVTEKVEEGGVAAPDVFSPFHRRDAIVAGAVLAFLAVVYILLGMALKAVLPLAGAGFCAWSVHRWPRRKSGSGESSSASGPKARSSQKSGRTGRGRRSGKKKKRRR